MNRGFLSRVVSLVMPATCLWAFQTGAEFSLYHKCRKPDVQPGKSGRIPFTTRNIMAVIMPRFGLCTVGIVSHSTRNAVSYPAKSPAIRAPPPPPPPFSQFPSLTLYRVKYVTGVLANALFVLQHKYTCTTIANLYQSFVHVHM